MPDQDPPIACTLDAQALPAREAEFRELLSEALVAGERTERGLRLRFRADRGVEEKVRDLARREKDCCAFFDFDIVREGDQVRLDWSVPEGAQELLDVVQAEWVAQVPKRREPTISSYLG